MSEQIQFEVNGSAVSVSVDPTTPLLYVLRNDLELRGTRHGCGEGECGACTVLLDGVPVTSCNLQVQAASGGRVETVEGLAAEGHALIDAVLTEQAAQCGYCLSGILMRAKALLAANPRPADADIAHALDENLCRCGAHNRIVRAIALAGEALAGETPAAETPAAETPAAETPAAETPAAETMEPQP